LMKQIEEQKREMDRMQAALEDSSATAPPPLRPGSPPVTRKRFPEAGASAELPAAKQPREAKKAKTPTPSSGKGKRNR